MLRTAVYSIAFLLGGLAIYSAIDSKEAVSGSVSFDNGDTAPFAEISVYDQATKELIYTTVADENGQFSLEQIAPGNYEINLSYTGHQTKSTSLTLEKGESRELGRIALQSLFANDAYTITPKVKTYTGS